MKKFKLSLYIHYFFEDFIFIYPFYALYFQDNGIDGIKFSLLMMIWVLAVMVFEIPSGVLADRFSRKGIILFGETVRIIGYLIWMFFPSFIGFAIGFIFWGFKSALRSGAIEALIYDNLLVHDEMDQFEHIMSRARFLSIVSIIVVTLLSAWLVSYGYHFLIWLSAVSLVISMIGLLGIKDLRIEETSMNMKEIFLTGIKHLKSKKIIYLIMLGQSLYIMGMLDEYWGLFSNEVGFSKFEIGIIIVILASIEALFVLTAPYLKKIIVPFFIFGGGLLVAFTIKSNPYIAIAGVGVANAAFKTLSLVVDVRFQHAFRSDVRATVTSVKGFLDEIFCIAFYGVLALLATFFDYTNMFYYAAVLTIVIGVILGFIGRKVEVS